MSLIDQTKRPYVILESGRADKQYWRDVWRYRELFFILAWRDVSVRYKQTIIGIAWGLLRPFLTMVVFTFIFGHIAKLPSEGSIPYALLVFVGMLPWYLFSSVLSEASASIVGNSNLIGKVYFPRIVMPFAAMVVALVDFLVSFAILIALMFWYGVVPGWQIVLLPIFVIFALLASIGPALWIAALNVKYRDFRYVIPFVLQFGLYISPVGFSSAIVPNEWRLLYYLNPVVSVIDGFRWSLLGGVVPLSASGFAAGVAVTAFFLWWGIRQFRRTERGFADLV